jgi:hypothetical protein
MIQGIENLNLKFIIHVEVQRNSIDNKLNQQIINLWLTTITDTTKK